MAIQSPAVPYPTFEKKMHKLNMHKPGNTVSVKVFDGLIKNKLPKSPTCKDCEAQKLARLSYLGKFRDDGLMYGRYTGQDGNIIRTYPVTANNAWVRNYANKSCNAAIRGKKLNDSTALMHMKHKTTNSVHFDTAIQALSNIK